MPWLEAVSTICQLDIATPRRVVRAALRGLGLAPQGNPSMSIRFDPSSLPRSASQSSPWPINFRNGLPPATSKRLEFRVRRLASAFNLGSVDQDEVRSTFVLEIYRALTSYQPGRSAATSFAEHVLKRAYVRIAKRLRRECTIRKRQQPLESILERADAGEHVAVGNPRTSQADVALARQLVDTDLGFDLARMSLRDAARLRGINPGTLSRHLAALRRTAMSQS